jgi:hypothetical protein
MIGAYIMSEGGKKYPQNYVGKPERKITIWRARHNRECNNIRDIKEMGYKDAGWTSLD